MGTPPFGNCLDLRSNDCSRTGIKKIKIHTDSKFLLNAMTNWIHKWKQNGWLGSKQKPVKNKEKFFELDKAVSSMEEVEWVCDIVRNH